MSEIFFTAFSVAFLAELRPDKTLCAGGALVTRYPVRAVVIGGSAALVAKMVLLAYAGATLYAQLPPTWRDAPRYLAALTLIVTAFLLLRGSQRQQSDATPAIASASVTRLTGSSCMWRPVVATFVVMFFAEWFDRAQLLVMSVAAEGVKTAGMSSPLWAGLGGALAMIVKEVIGVAVGTRLRKFIAPRTLMRFASAVCLLLALLTFFDDEHMTAQGRHIHRGQLPPAAVCTIKIPSR